MKMKYKRLFGFIVLLVLSGAVFSQTGSCYEKYKTRGDNAKRNKSYDIAIKQYQAAKLCDSVNLDKIQAIDNLIDATYQLWVTDLKNAQKIADNAAAESLISLAGDYVFKGNMNKAYSIVTTSPARNNPAIVNYIAEISPFIADTLLENIVALDSFSFKSRDFVALFQKQGKATNNFRRRFDGSSSKAGEKLKPTDNNDEQEDDTKILRVIILDVTTNTPKSVFSETLESDVLDNDYDYRFERKNDSLIIKTTTKNYVYKIGSHSLEQAGINHIIKANDFKAAPQIDYVKLNQALLKYGLTSTVTNTVYDSADYYYRYQLSVQEDNSGKTIFSLPDVKICRYMDDLKQLLIVSKDLTDSSFRITFFSVPSFTRIDSISNLAVVPTTYYINTNGLIELNIKLDNNRTDTAKSATAAIPKVKNKRILYDIAGKHVIDEKSTEGRYAYNIVKIKNGFLFFNNAYGVERDLRIYDSNLEEKKRYLTGNNGTYEYFFDNNRLLLLCRSRVSTEPIAVSQRNRTVSANKVLPVDTLKVIDLNTNDSLLYTGKKIDIFNGAIVTIKKDSSVEILDLSGKNNKRIAYFENINPISIDSIGNKYLSIKCKEGFENNNNDTITIIFSIKKGKQILKAQKIIPDKKGNIFLCYTNNAGMQQLCYIDSLSDNLIKINVNLSRDSIPEGGIHYYPKKELIYFISNSGGAGETSEEGFMLSILKGQKLPIKYFAQSTIKLFYLSNNKIRTINSIEVLQASEDLDIVGDFLILKGGGSILGADEEAYEKYLLFSITPRTGNKRAYNRNLAGGKLQH